MRQAGGTRTAAGPGPAATRRGDRQAALTAIRRIAAETTQPAARAGLLPAYVEIMLAWGDVDEARGACGELERIAEAMASGVLVATAATARGSVELADGALPAALVALRHAWQSWQELEVPYEAARTRVLVGVACRELGDEEAAELELEAARGTFEQLGAAPDLARIDSLNARDGRRCPWSDGARA